MKKFVSGLMLAGSALSGQVLAGVTTAPTGPSFVSITWTLGGLDTTGVTLEASGSATMQGSSWAALVADTPAGQIKLGEDAGLSFRPGLRDPADPVFVWRDITVDLARQVVTGDAYWGGVKQADNRVMFGMGLVNGGADALPAGTTTLWANRVDVCQLAVPCVTAAIWDPGVLGVLRVQPVPEPSTAMTGALGLLALGYVVRRARRVPGAATPA